jgi:hypothetical protein
MADHQRMEAVEGFPHVARLQSQEDPQAAGKSQHDRIGERWRSNSTAQVSCLRQAISMRVPSASVIRMGSGAAGGSDVDGKSTVTSANRG